MGLPIIITESWVMLTSSFLLGFCWKWNHWHCTASQKAISRKGAHKKKKCSRVLISFLSKPPHEMFQGYLQKAWLWHTAARAIRADVPLWREVLSGMDDCSGQVWSPGSPSVLEVWHSCVIVPLHTVIKLPSLKSLSTQETVPREHWMPNAMPSIVWW